MKNNSSVTTFRKFKRQAAFTLIELLTTISLVGILSAIALPQFSEYKAKGFDARAKSDLRNVAAAEEAYYSENFTYVDCDQDSCPVLLPELNYLSEGVILQVTATAAGFTGTATHPQGSGSVFTWDQ